MLNTRGELLAIVVLVTVLTTSQGYTQGAGFIEPVEPWVSAPSAFAKQFQNWQLKFEAGKPYDAPERGVFEAQSCCPPEGVYRLVDNLNTSPGITLTPVAHRTRYMRADKPRDKGDLVVTAELIDILRRPDVKKLIKKDRLGIGSLDYNKDLQFVLVQSFDAAVRIPKKKEHVVYIRWSFVRETPGDLTGMEVLGMFIRKDTVLKPIYVVVNRAYETHVEDLEVLATADLNGDGVDEFITRLLSYEQYDDRLAILARIMHDA